MNCLLSVWLEDWTGFSQVPFVDLFFTMILCPMTSTCAILNTCNSIITNCKICFKRHITESYHKICKIRKAQYKKKLSSFIKDKVKLDLNSAISVLTWTWTLKWGELIAYGSCASDVWFEEPLNFLNTKFHTIIGEMRNEYAIGRNASQNKSE